MPFLFKLDQFTGLDHRMVPKNMRLHNGEHKLLHKLWNQKPAAAKDGMDVPNPTKLQALTSHSHNHKYFQNGEQAVVESEALFSLIKSVLS